MDEKRICKKCLLREMDQDLYFEQMKDYIENLDPEDKAEADVYEKRLFVCKDCDYLNAGMCRACGCYVEMRAAMKLRHCPYDKW